MGASMYPCDVIILAGGLGTRLRSVVSDRPKVMAEVNGSPFLAWILRALSSQGIERVILSVGYLGDSIRDFFGDSMYGMRLIYSEEETPLGTGGGARLASQFVTSPRCFVVNGDSWCVTNLREYAAWHASLGAPASLVAVEVPDARRYGTLGLGDDDRVLWFEEKSPAIASGFINAGIYLVATCLLHSLPARSSPLSLEREVLPEWVRSGLYAYRSKADFIDIGLPESYAACKDFNFGLPQL